MLSFIAFRTFISLYSFEFYSIMFSFIFSILDFSKDLNFFESKGFLFDYLFFSSKKLTFL